MLVEINLLPQKEKKSKAVYIIFALIILILILAVVIFSLFIKDKNQQVEKLENQMTQINVILDAERSKLTAYESSSSINDLETAIKWAKEQPYNTVYVLQQLTKILPDRGFVTEFEMNEENTINIAVQFDTKSEAAYYLHSLFTLDWIEEAVLNEAKTTEISKDNQDNETKEEEFLPRYVAQYELIINVSSLKASYQEYGKSTENEKDKDTNQEEVEGGTTP
ncbi:PilN domain-containing protein [Cytobacillus sp. FJAT-53684]|uniref:PilN domain-containing protein n=1 Tax=Cytobacillus mangrovibacter TaxID=3299024 RepID=A0ABW6JYA1_9BACI